MGLRLTYEDQLRRATPEQLPAYSAAVLAQFVELRETANAWASENHANDGTHTEIHLKSQTTAAAVAGHMVIYWNGTNLKYVKPDGTTGNIV